MTTPSTTRTTVLAAVAALLAACLGSLTPAPAAHAGSPSFAGFGSESPTVDPGDGVATGPICVNPPVGRPCDAPSHGYATSAFSPQFSASASTLEAGAHPDLTLGFSRPLDHCVGELPGEVDPNTDGDGFFNTCKESELQLEQDLRRVSFSLPTGMKLDLSGVPYCDSDWGWLTVEPSPDFLLKVYQEFCHNPDAQVGTVDIASTTCGPWIHQDRALCFLPVFGGEEPGVEKHDVGVVYNERPRDGERGHLVVLWRGDPARPTLSNFIRYDFSVKQSGGGVELVADPFPVIGGEGRKVVTWRDTVEHRSVELPIQPARFALTLRGSAEAEAGHPLLTNPRACAPRTIRAELHGYAVIAWSDWWAGQDELYGYFPLGRPGEGVGASFSDAVPYDVADCNESEPRPGAPPHDDQAFDSQPPNGGPPDGEQPGSGPDSQHPSNSSPDVSGGNGQAPVGQPTLEARVDGNRAGGNARLRLAVRSPAEPIEALRFDVEGKLSWTLRGRPRRRDRATRNEDASVAFLSSSGSLKAHLEATPAAGGSLRFTPVGSRRGRTSPPQLRRFSTLLSHRGRARGDKAASTLALRGLPRRKPSEVSLVLGGRGSSLALRGPEACDKSLAVTATIKTVGGHSFLERTNLRVAGKRCDAAAGT